MIGVTLLPASRQEKDPDRLSSPRPELRAYKAKKNTKKKHKEETTKSQYSTLESHMHTPTHPCEPHTNYP